MDLERIPGLRQALAIVLMLALTMAGVGRGLADAPEALPSFITIADVAVPICHAGHGDGSDPAGPGSPSRRDCCDLCALSAPIIAPRPPVLSRPAIATRLERPLLQRAASPPPHGVYTPRQSQGPPRIA